jgi:hypothetical protein
MRYRQVPWRPRAGCAVAADTQRAQSLVPPSDHPTNKRIPRIPIPRKSKPCSPNTRPYVPSASPPVGRYYTKTFALTNSRFLLVFSAYNMLSVACYSGFAAYSPGAAVAKLAYAAGLKSAGDFPVVGSTPTSRTTSLPRPKFRRHKILFAVQF